MTEIHPAYSVDQRGEHEVLLRIVPPLKDVVAKGVVDALTEEMYTEDYGRYPATNAQVTGDSEGNATIIRATPTYEVRDRNTEGSRKEDALRVARRVTYLLNPWQKEDNRIKVHEPIDLSQSPTED